jgi:transposase-like protein
MVVVESGSARCPRCMAPAVYRFHESVDGLIRYEVSCQLCGNAYFEDCVPAPVQVPAA